MGIPLSPLPAFLLAGAFLVAAVFVFGRVRADYERNPQLVGGFLFIIGYALLWPS